MRPADETVVEQVPQTRGTGGHQRVKLNVPGINQVVIVELELRHHVRDDKRGRIDGFIREMRGLQQLNIDQTTQCREPSVKHVAQVNQRG